ncbi:hypothetical protein BD779DRAFT_1678187 [Infundibulicybe gibba]|nr:hypothetical protein BD779DRAFT_1678187 [Infundibulicybe gibba]
MVARSSTPQITQLVQIGSGKGKCAAGTGDTHCFVLPHTYTPPVTDIPPPIPELLSIVKADQSAPMGQTWAQELGWEEEIVTLARQMGTREKAIEKLLDLVALPCKKRVEQCTDDVSRAVERGLLLSNQLNLRYLRDGAQWVAGMHAAVRGHFSYKHSKPFRPQLGVTDGYRYRRLHIATETFAVRSLLDTLLNRATVATKCAGDTDRAVQNLMRLFLESNGAPDHEELLTKKHHLFTSILCGPGGSEDKVGCLIEQALIACSLQVSGHFSKAALIQSRINFGLWSFQATFANWCRLETQGLTSYVPLDLSECSLVQLGNEVEEYSDADDSDEDLSADEDATGLGGDDEPLALSTEHGGTVASSRVISKPLLKPFLFN